MTACSTQTKSPGHFLHDIPHDPPQNDMDAVGQGLIEFYRRLSFRGGELRIIVKLFPFLN